jgi:hypothetical protein
MAARERKRRRLVGRNSPTSSRRLEAAERRRKALELRKAGATYDSIAQELGFANKGAAHKTVMVALDNTIREPANEVRKLELERLDRLFLTAWALALKGDLKAMDRCLNISRHRASLEGLNIEKLALTDPTGEKEFSGGYSEPERLARIAALLDQARARRDGQAASADPSTSVDTPAGPPDAGLPHAGG